MTDLAPASLQAETAPAPDFINRLSSSLARVIDHEGWVFSFKSADQTFVISSEEMSAPDGFLPIVLHRASHWMTQSMGDRALMGFRIDAGGIARVVPETMGPTASVAVWTTFAHYALDEWVRRRVRLYYWKQWKQPRTRRRHLLALGIDPKEVHMATRSRKGYWRMSGNSLIQRALTNRWLQEQGVPNMRTLWITLHYGAKARV